VSREILAFEARDNAQLMLDCETLGYLDKSWLVLDCTYGLGAFWRDLWLPKLIRHGIGPHEDGHYDDGVSFTQLPEADDTFDATVFDPPYKLNGMSTGRGPSAADARFGVTSYMPVEERHALMRNGLVECIRVTKPGGYILAKCQDQVASGRVHWQTSMLAAMAKETTLVDMLFVPGHRKQPDRGQQHARRNYSTLLVFRKDRQR
jgi:hypothetical protein